MVSLLHILNIFQFLLLFYKTVSRYVALAGLDSRSSFFSLWHQTDTREANSGENFLRKGRETVVSPWEPGSARVCHGAIERERMEIENVCWKARHGPRRDKGLLWKYSGQCLRQGQMGNGHWEHILNSAWHMVVCATVPCLFTINGLT